LSALLGRPGVPLHALGVVLGHALAFLVAHREAIHRKGRALGHRLGEQRNPLFWILLHASSLKEENGQVAKAHLVVPVRGLAVPAGGGGEIACLFVKEPKP
jgi:hypothetical protein